MSRVIGAMAMRWAPAVLAAGAAIALFGALIVRGSGAFGFLALFVVLLPAAASAALIRWWPRCRSTEAKAQGINWRRKLRLAGAGLLLAAAVTLVLGVAWAGGRIGTTLLVAGTLLLPPAALVALLAFLLSRGSALSPQERIVYEASTHWGIFLPAIGTLTVVLLLVAGPFGVIGYGAATVLYLILLPGLAGRALSSFVNTELIVTEGRLLAATGLVPRRSLRLPLAELSNVGVSQSWLGRMLAYGKVIVIGPDGTSLVLPAVEDPMALREKLRASRADAADPASQSA